MEKFRPKPYDPLLKPNPSSSLLARFRGGSYPLFPLTKPKYRNIAEGCFEINKSRTFIPLTFAIGHSRIVVLGGSVWKERDPGIEVYRLGRKELTGKSWVLPFLDLASAAAIDDTRSLIWVADDYRIKSYRWDNNKYTPLHTFKRETS